MATGNGVNQGKTAFLEEFLPDNRDADEAAINQAWRAEGHDDDISGSLVSKTRSRLKIPKKRGATGGADAGPKAKGKAKPKGAKGKAKRGRRDPASARRPGGRHGAEQVGVRRGVARSAARGQRGGGQPGLGGGGPRGVDQPFGLLQDQAGTGRERRGYDFRPGEVQAGVGVRGAGPGQATVEARPELYGETVLPPVSGSESGDRERVLDRVEDGIDDLIIELKRLGGMEEALEAMRKVRRVVVRSHGG